MQKTRSSAMVIISVGLLACANRSGNETPESASSASNAQGSEDMSAEATGGGAAGSSGNSGGDMQDRAATNDTGMTGSGSELGAVQSMDAASGALSNMPLTDGQILKIAETVDEGEVEQAQAMQDKAQNAQVKRLAQHLIQQHQKNEQKVQRLEQTVQMMPEESALSHDLQQTAQQTIQQIQQEETRAAERTFVNAQVTQHQKVLQLLDDRLIPSAIDSDLKARLEETRKMLEQHMKEAKKVQEALSSQAGTSAPSS
jgi:putative membrane protein